MIAVAVVFTVTPWNVIPAQVTEDVTVIANTEYGCVGESQYGTSVLCLNVVHKLAIQYLPHLMFLREN